MKWLIYSLGCFLNGMALGVSHETSWIVVGIVGLLICCFSSPMKFN